MPGGEEQENLTLEEWPSEKKTKKTNLKKKKTNLKKNGLDES